MNKFVKNYLINENLEETEIIEEHLHNKERWYGMISGNNTVNAIEDNFIPFRITSGAAGVYGTEVCLFGSSDVIYSNALYFDLHSFLIYNVQKAELKKIRYVWGTGTHAEAITAGQYSTVMVNFTTSTGKSDKIDILMPKIANGNKVWISIKTITTSNQWIDLFIGGHGYPVI